MGYSESMTEVTYSVPGVSCDHCRTAATAAGYDWAAMERDTRALWDRLHNLTAADVKRAADPADLLASR